MASNLIFVDCGKTGLKKKLKYGNNIGVTIPAKHMNAKTIGSEVLKATSFLLQTNKKQNRNSLQQFGVHCKATFHLCR